MRKLVALLVLVTPLMLGAKKPPVVDPLAFAPIDYYTLVYVEDFADGTEATSSKPDKLARYKEEVRFAGVNFGDILASELRLTRHFPKVLRSPREKPFEGLLISGEILGFDRGNVGRRAIEKPLLTDGRWLLVRVRFTDIATGRELGTVEVDEHSWGRNSRAVRGVGMERYMRGAAKRVAAALQISTR